VVIATFLQALVIFFEGSVCMCVCVCVCVCVKWRLRD